MLNRSPDPTPSSELEQLAAEVRRLRYDFRDPERYYEQRSEVAAAIMRLSRRLAGRAMPAQPINLLVPIPRRRPMPLRTVAVAVPQAPKLVETPPTPPRPTIAPRRARPRRHRYPRPPTDPRQAALL